MSQDYNKLEDQIGELGGDSNEQHSLGKLKHKASYGQKEDLNADDKESLEAFKSKSSAAHKAKIQSMNDAPIANGWIPIDKKEMGSRAQFYPADWQFSIRPASVNAIKNWTAINEENLAEVNKVFNEIIKSCVKIDSPSSYEPISWEKINSWDRFWFVLKVREYTFTQGESKVEFTDNCSLCSETMVYTLTSKSLFYEFPDEDLIEKYWTGKEWCINPRDYDVDHDEITLYTPTLGKEEAIIEWARARQMNHQQIDELFIKYLIWLLKTPASDPIQLDRQIAKIYTNWKAWDLNMHEFVSDVLNNITINPSEKLRCKCPSCGREAVSTLRFPDGIKVLFKVKTTAKKFGSK